VIARYSRPEMAAIWTDARRYDLWLEVELAACEAMEEADLVPAGTAAALRPRVRLDPARIAELEAGTRHDVIAFLTHVEELGGEPARWLHLGMTSSDVLDSAFALQLRAAADLLLAGVTRLGEALGRRAREHRRTPMIGRTHGMHAEPTTAGLVFAGLAAEIGRHRERLVRAREAIAVGKIAGAVGVYGALSPEIEARALLRLGLVPERVATQVVARDRHAELFSALALCASGVERLALQIRHWQRTEVGEAEELFAAGQKGSSAMPHKRNPVASENLCGMARLVRGYAAAALENVALWHERDISHSSVERIAAPDATGLLDFMLARAAGLVERLVVYPARMRVNLDRSGDLVYSEAVLLALIKKGLPRQRAYEHVQKHAMAQLGGGPRLRDGLAADPEVAALVPPGELGRLFDLDHHLRHVDAIFARAIGEAT
jgi:adenylosuccinate lyase